MPNLDLHDHEQLVSSVAVLHSAFMSPQVSAGSVDTVAAHTDTVLCHPPARPAPCATTGMHARLQGQNCDDLGAVLGTLVQLTTHDAGRDALVSAGVPAMAADWLRVNNAARLSTAGRDQPDESPQPGTATAPGEQQTSSSASSSSCGNDQQEKLSQSQGHGDNADSAADAIRASLTLQLLRLIRNLCAAGAAAADPLTAGGVPAQLAQLVMGVDPRVPGDACARP